MSAEAWPVASVATSVSHRRHRRIIGGWLFAICGLIAVMVLIGGLTRLTHSGLSITQWKPVTGVIPPLSDAAWQAEFARYKRIPEYRLINAGMSLAAFKDIYWWEWTHRLIGRLIGVAFFVPFVFFAARRWIDRSLAPRLATIFVLGGAQGALGWYMVQSGLVNRTDVSQYRLAAHLGFAFVLFALILWHALDLTVPARRRGRHDLRGLRNGLCVLLALVFGQILLGALVAGLDAGLVYNSWPLMEGRLVPHGLFPGHPWWINFFATVKTVQFDHRMVAYLVGCLTIGLWLTARVKRLPRRAARAIDVLGMMVALQITLGVLTLVNVMPVPLAAAHQFGALLTFTACVVAVHATIRATQPGPALAVVR